MKVYAFGRLELYLERRELRAEGVALPVGSRAVEILKILVEADSALVTKDELIARIWPGAIVGENMLQVHVSALRKAMGSDRDLLQTVSGRGYRLIGDRQVREEHGPPYNSNEQSLLPLATGADEVVLPTAQGELIGRGKDVDFLLHLTTAYRVVTASGPGGIGKTALALEAARRLQPHFRKTWFVELASLTTPNLVAAKIAGDAGLSVRGNQITPVSVARAIGARQVLLVLDNCEHVIEAVAELAAAVVSMCSGAVILATSREALGIDGEYVLRVGPLTVPSIEEDTETLPANPAVRLFLARMQAASEDSLAEQGILPSVATICRRLDGIPLGIELAAARAAVLGVREVESRLDDRFGLLTAGRRTALPRQQTLHGTLDWSYELLSYSEQRCLRQLAVFRGGFTLGAAAAVMPVEPGAELPVLGDISNLVMKSLVVFDRPGSSDRWRLLETIRLYALEKLTEAGEEPDARRRHALFFHEMVSAAESLSALEPTTEASALYVSEIDNVRAAMEWALSPEGDVSIGITLISEYVPIWLELSLLAECRERIERVLGRMVGDWAMSRKATMLLNIGLSYSLLHTSGAASRVTTALNAALAIAQARDDVVAQNYVFWGLWACDIQCGQARQALRNAGRFARLATRTRSPARRLVAGRLVGSTMHYRGHQARARDYLEEVLKHHHEISDGRHVVWFRYDIRVMTQASLARVLCLQGFQDQARRLAQATSDDAHRAGHALMLCHCLGEALCSIALLTEDNEAANGSIALLIDAATRHGVGAWVDIGRCMDGAWLISRGQWQEGTQRLRAALDSGDKTGWMLYRPMFMGMLAKGLVLGGRLCEAEQELDRALLLASTSGEQWYVPELLRIRSGVYMRRRRTAAAEAGLLSAITLSQRQGALLWELSATTDLARLRGPQDQGGEARHMLETVYGRFTEGFQTVALRSARETLTFLAET